MNAAMLLWPAIAQAGLIGAIYGLLGIVRRRAVLEGRAHSTDFPPGNEPPDSAALRRHLANQFELPVLFFIVIGYHAGTGTATPADIWLAWAFVASRLVHSAGSLLGPLNLRHAAFAVGAFLLAAMWARLALGIV